MAPLSPRRPGPRSRDGGRAAARSAGRSEPQTLAESINATLAEILTADRRVIVFGEDVGVKGGVYGVTRGLARRLGAARVFDTAAGRAVDPRPRARGRAGRADPDPGDPVPRLPAQRRRSTARRGRDPVVLLLAAGSATRWWFGWPGWPTRRASAGTSTTTTRSAVLRDIPGLVVACPARADDAAGDAAHLRGRGRDRRDGVGVPRADRALPPARPARRRATTAGWPPIMVRTSPIGRARGLSGRRGADLTHDHLRQRGADEPAGRSPAGRARHRADVLDLRWLAPLPVADAAGRRGRTGRVLVVDETRPRGRGRRRGDHRAGRARLPGTDRPGGQRGQLRPAGSRRRSTCCSSENRHRESSHHAGGTGTRS